MSRNRVETFSDAVMALISTLLVLELRAPELGLHAGVVTWLTPRRGPQFTAD